MKRKTILIIAYLFLSGPGTALANPSVSIPFGFSALFVETAILILLLIPFRFDWLRIFYTWLGVTLGTWLLFIVVPLRLFTILSDRLYMPFLLPIWMLIPAEVIIIVVEAYILRFFSGRTFFRVGPPVPLSIGRALSLSLTVNAVSFAAGLV
jgi:hypothetical protein